MKKKNTSDIWKKMIKYTIKNKNDREIKERVIFEIFQL